MRIQRFGLERVHCISQGFYLCSGEVVDLTDYEVNTIASLLKQYLRELPEALIPPRLAAKFESVTGEKCVREKLATYLFRMPTVCVVHF